MGILSVTKENRLLGGEKMTAKRLDDNHFECPACGGKVTITYSNGWPNVGLMCDQCGSQYSINRI